MKKFFFITILFFACFTLRGQRLPSFDESIRTMRYNAVPGLHYGWDDYTQYAPAVVTLGLKACGYESRSSWGRMVVADAFSAAGMVLAVNGLKYTICRPRPDGTSSNSFPSGHTATSFLAASIMHKEYGWRSPWFSFGAYALASVTGVSRIINDRHYATDVIAGAVIGTAAVHLGYFIADKIFKEKYLADGYAGTRWEVNTAERYYELGLYFGYRFIFGGLDSGAGGFGAADGAGVTGGSGSSGGSGFAGGSGGGVAGGGVAGLDLRVPVLPRVSVLARAGVGSYLAGAGATASVGASSSAAGASGGGVSDGTGATASAGASGGGASASGGAVASYNTYEFLLGAGWNWPFAKVLEFEAKAFAGYSLSREVCSGFDFATEACLAVLTGDNFKLKAFVGYNAIRYTRQRPFLHAASVGGSAVFFW